MAEHNVIAILYPKPGKVDQMRVGLKKLIDAIHAKEDYTTRYLLSEEIDTDTPQIVIVETYKSKEAMMQHSKESHFQLFFESMTKDDIMAKEPLIIRTVDKAGFDKDRILISTKA